MITVILVDDHALVRTGMKHMLSQVKGIQVVGEAEDAAQTFKLVEQKDPDVVILDLKLRGISGLQITEKLLRANPQAKILIVTAATHDLFPFRLLEAGATGYLTKEASQEELVRAVRAINSGQRVLSPDIASRLALSKMETSKSSTFETLSAREVEVMMMVIQGAPAADIADRLHLSPKTVHSYRKRIFDKLNVKNDVELALVAIRAGVVDMDIDML